MGCGPQLQILVAKKIPKTEMTEMTKPPLPKIMRSESRPERSGLCPKTWWPGGVVHFGDDV